MLANKQIHCFLAVLALVFACAGCSKEHLKAENTHGIAGDPYPKAPAKTAPELRIIMWKGTVSPATIKEFEKRYGIKVQVTFCGKVNELLQQLTKHPDSWDVIMTNDYAADYLQNEGLIQPVPKLNPFIYRYINTSVINPDADPQMKYFIPNDYAAFGISFNTDYMANFPRDWQYLTEHRGNPYIYGRVVISDDMRFAFATALLYLGLDPNSTNPTDILKAKELLESWVRDLGLRFIPFTTVATELKKDDALMAVAWSGTAGGLLRYKQECRFLLPEGKCIMSLDGFSISATSKCPETAALFIEFMLHPYVSMQNSNYSMYASVNIRAMQFVDRFILNGPSSMIPTPNNMVFINYLSDDKIDAYAKAWAEVKSVKIDPDKIKIIPVN